MQCYDNDLKFGIHDTLMATTLCAKYLKTNYPMSPYGAPSINDHL